MQSKMWMNTGPDFASPGDVAFVLEISPQQKATYYTARKSPGRTNLSNKPCLAGWLGETNNTSAHAIGVWEVIRVAASNQDRVEARRLMEDGELMAALEKLGYPELIPTWVVG